MYHRMLFSFGIGEWLGKAQQIVCRYLKVGTDDLDILKAGLIPAPFQVRELSLGHIQSLSQLRLIQILFFPEEFQLFAKGQFHYNHRE